MNSVRSIVKTVAKLRTASSRVALLGLLALLASCGFALRGAVPMPFDTFYTTVTQNTKFGADLRRAIRATSPNTTIVEVPKDADAQLIQISNSRALREVSLNAQGRVEQYELTIVFVFRLVDNKGNALLPDTTLVSTRELPYNDQLVQAKQSEIDRLFDIMQNSLVDRILRRITSPEVREAALKNAANPGVGAPTSDDQDHRLDPDVLPSPNRPQDQIIPWNQTTITTPGQPSW
jgi:LPS-assembly lipoprotein